MIRFGKISEIISNKGLARVSFSGDSVVSAELPCLVRKSKSIKESYPFEVNEQVACLMNDDMRTGVILGAIYSKNEVPSITSENEFGIDFGPVGKEVFNSQTGKRELKANMTKIGNDIESIGGLLNEIVAACAAITVINPETTTPLSIVNIAQFQAFIPRIQSFLE